LFDSWLLRGGTIAVVYEITLFYSFYQEILKMFVIHIILVLWIIYIYNSERTNKEEFIKQYKQKSYLKDWEILLD